MTDPLARILAVIGLVLSAVKIGYDWWKDRRRAKVRVELANIRGQRALSVSVINTSYRPTTIEGLGVFFDDGHIMGAGNLFLKEGAGHVVTFDSDISSTALPMRIEDGEPATIYYPWDRVVEHHAPAAGLIGIVAWDAEGRECDGKLPRYVKNMLKKETDEQENPPRG